jgi:hypothetical protein
MDEDPSLQDFPTVKQLREGILLGCIAHALWLAWTRGSFAGIGWIEEDTYLEDNEQGERWATAFTPAGTIAVFASSESERNPCPKGRPPYDQARYFRGMPDTLQKAKERALHWMINLDYKLGGPEAVITAAMWADGDRFTANEPWEVVFEHGAWACRRQLLPFEVAAVEWQSNFALEDADAAVLRSLYLRRLASTETMIPVEPGEKVTIFRNCEGTARAAGQVDPGISAARVALASVGIVLELDD